MLPKLLKNRTGFTLIEVVIVLAIAGLIFVIVFLAVSAAQAARRDTQRKSDADRFVAAVNQYASNHNGDIPNSDSDADSVVSQYMKDPKSPDGTPYTVDYATSGTPSDGQLIYHDGQKCNDTSMTGGSSRQFAVLFYQERGGTACRDNQ